MSILRHNFYTGKAQMDDQTIKAYDRQAESVANLHQHLIPNRIYELIRTYFTLNASTLDVGCGIGRDTQWLIQNGYLALGVDASMEMLKQAESLYPIASFCHDALPRLESLNSQYKNILCSAVLMHLHQDSLEAGCTRLLELLQPKGVLIVSYRSTNEPNKRENGKLYENIDVSDFKKLFINLHAQILVQETDTETGRNLTWYNWVIKK